MLYVCTLILHGALAILVVLYASAVVLVIVNVVAGAVMNAIFIRDHRRLDGRMD